MRKNKKTMLKQKKNYRFLIIMQIIFILFSIIFISNKVKAARNYTSINSTTIFDKSSLDSLNLNINDFPEVTVEGSEKAQINNPKTESRNDYRVTFNNVPKGNKIDATVTVTFKNCGTLNGRNIDMKIVYSNMVASSCIYAPNQSFLFWRTFGKTDNQKDENEWWYAGIERVDLNISFYYHNEENPIHLDTAYISIYSEDYGEGVFANRAAENYLYDDTTIEYHPDNYKTEYVSTYYPNVFVGTARESTSSGNKERVGFRYEDETNLRLTLLAFDETQNVGYHLRFTPLTGVVPDNPEKSIVNKKDSFKPGERIIYEIKQPLIKRFDDSFQYDSIIFEDILDSRLEFNSISVDFSTGTQITQSEIERETNRMGQLIFKNSQNKLTWELDWNKQHLDPKYSFVPFQMLVDANGGWIKLTITTTIRDDAEEGDIKNKATTRIQNKYELTSNEVKSTVKKEVEPEVTKGRVVVHHVDKITNTELDTDILEDDIGKVVRTMSKTIDGYDRVESPSTEMYEIKKEEQHVFYYYKYKCEIVVHHIDKINKHEFYKESKRGLEGTTITTKPYENADKYKIFEKPQTEEYEFLKEPQDVYYYYKRPGNITVHHIDEKTGIELEQEKIDGLEKDIVRTNAKEINDYKISKKPENEEYEISVDGKDVYYYYVHISKGVIVKHIDINSNELLEPEEKLEGNEGDEYNVSKKDFPNYTFVKDSGNITGNMSQDLIEVKFYYIYNSKIRVHHIYGENGGEDIEEIFGKEGQKYVTHSKTSPIGHDGKLYKLDNSRIPKNDKGTLKKQNSDVYYYYILKTGNIVVKHLDKATGESIVPESVIQGFTGDKYETNRVNDSDYELVEEPKNKKGVFTEGSEQIIYYYLRKTYVIVNYIDEKKDEVIESEKINGLETDEYITNPKEFEYYRLSENKYPKNNKGNFEKEPIIINYYYSHLLFNFKVNHIIDKIVINDEQKTVNKTLGKTEINKNLNEYNIKIYYKIIITNNMEVMGNTEIIEFVPEGFCTLIEDNPDWNINGNKATFSVQNLYPGEQREYFIILTNINKKVTGVIPNKVIIENSTNEAQLNETNYEDNVSNTEMIIGIATGSPKNIKEIFFAFCVPIFVIVLLIVKLKK